MLPPIQPPNNLCILRLSALGDICHALPVVRTLQQHWPQTNIAWIIGKIESQLIGDIPDIEFIIYDKKAGLRAYQTLYHQLKSRQFDLLLHMQTSLRSNMINLLVRAKIKLGYDWHRAKELHWFVNQHHLPSITQGQHQIDDLFNFIETLGIKHRQLIWNIPIPPEAQQKHQAVINNNTPYLVINPCSSPSPRIFRNWYPSGYAQVANYATETLALNVVLCGDNTQQAHQQAQQISQQMHHQPINLIGQTTLKELLVILKHATLLISSDSGPVHFATAVNTPVIGLYAPTNPYQTGPYCSYPWMVNKYPEAIQQAYHQTVKQVTWGKRVTHPTAMQHISTTDVIAQLTAFIRKYPPKTRKLS